MWGLFGNLVEPIHTVGRAERTAAFQAIRANPAFKVYVSDLLALVREGQSWDPELARGMQQYTAI